MTVAWSNSKIISKYDVQMHYIQIHACILYAMWRLPARVAFFLLYKKRAALLSYLNIYSFVNSILNVTIKVVWKLKPLKILVNCNLKKHLLWPLISNLIIKLVHIKSEQYHVHTGETHNLLFWSRLNPKKNEISYTL